MTRAQFIVDMKHDAEKKLYDQRMLFIRVAVFQRDRALNAHVLFSEVEVK